MSELNEIKLENVSGIDVVNILDKNEAVEIDGETNDFEVAFDEEEYDKGVKLGSFLAGMLAPILAIGIPHELAVDLVGNERTIAYNKDVIAFKNKSDIINEEIEIE